MKPKGVLIVDDVLLTHYGRHFENIACLYEPTEKRYVWAHNLVNLHYSDDQLPFGSGSQPRADYRLAASS